MSNAPSASAGGALGGVWSGDQHRLTIDADSARLETDCAGGTILGAIKPGRDGRFAATGTYEEYRPGPQRADTPASAATVNFVGEVRQGVMTLSIQTPGAGTRELTLREGANVKLRRCL